MRRLFRLSLPLLVLTVAGCAGGAAAPVEQTGAVARLRVGFPVRGLVDTVEIDAVDRLPLRSAELIAPNGAVIPAGYLHVAASPTFATGQSALSNTWRDAVEPGNLLPALVVGNAQAGAALRGHQQLLAMVSVAEIPLPDPIAYRRDWRHYHIRLSFGTPPGPLENRQLPAPAPLPDEPPPSPPLQPSPR
jgi:hypothetical protein